MNMTPNGTWAVNEKGVATTTPSRFERWRKNRLLVTLVTFVTCMLLLAIASGVAIYYYYTPEVKTAALFENPCDKMLCTYGSQCLVDESSHRAYCFCGETCSDVFAPVCGDDDVTYSSECQLRLSSCTQQRRIFVQRQGPCDIQDPCENMNCPFGSTCKTSLDGRTARCICPERCSLFIEDQVPVCGTDGKNYPNPCELEKMSCKEMRTIEIKFKGVCDPCEGIECPTSQICQLDEHRTPICRCNSICSPDFRPVCGSDGKTYTNECTLRVEACKLRRSIRIIYTGECSSGANPCEILQCGPYQGCDIDRHGKATCHCDDTCELVVRPVCGSDGQTYQNECEMRRQGCLQKKSLKLAYRGECGERGPCYQYHCSYGALCVVKGGFPSCECPTCAEEFEPVCGTDGISYTNNCKLRREACEQKSEIAVAYVGLCTGCENKRCEYYAVCESDGRGNGKCVCPQSCIKVEALICGTDEVTYQNECEMRVAACRKAQYVMVVSKGPCDLCQHVHCKYGARCENGRCVCPTDCPQVSETVCANDGVTYQNECQMRHAACLHDQELNMLFYGECDDVGESQDEGSGVGMDCDERSCKYGGVCEYDFEGLPHCSCNFQCALAMDPVCGSDGKLYDNECRLKEEACKQQKNIMPVHIEMCEEFREVPCDGEIPLIDPTTNKDYFCGEGIGSKLCPPGSYCHRSSAFSKCCREVILIKTCSESMYGCCPDGKTAAQGPNSAGCPSVCNCNRLGSYDLTCEPSSSQCFCKPGVGGPRCDRCEPGYWGLHKITEENNYGCTPCSCNLYGSVRDDCEQMTGRCVCKHGIQGMKCDICPIGTILSQDGCMDESIAQPVSGSCEDLMCFYGAQCRETQDDQAQCVCEFNCSPEDNKDLVCGSDGTTYGSECQMKLFSCRYQRTISVAYLAPCPKVTALEEDAIFLKHKQTEKKLDSKIFQRKSRNTRNVTSSLNASMKGYMTKEESSPNVVHLNFSSWMRMGNISLEIGFITMEKNGVIIYSDDLSGYKNSYMLLYLKNRFLEFRFTGEKGTIILNSSKQIAIGKYHHVSLKCLLRYAVMYLDKKRVAMEPYRETFCSKFLLKKMIIGSLPRLSQRDAKHKFRIPDFSGCIYKLKIGTQEVNLRNLRGIALKDSQMMNKFTTNKIFPTKMCLPLPIDSKNDSDPVSVIFSEEKALSTEVLEKTNTSFVLRTREHSKPIFSWIEHPSKDLQREIRISVQKGKTELWINFGGNVRRIIRSSKPINDNKFHNVTLEKSMKELTLFVDDEKKTIKLKDRWPLDFKNGNFFFSVSRNRLHPDKSSTKNITDIFRGCIKEMQLNGISLKLVGFLPEQFLCDPS